MTSLQLARAHLASGDLPAARRAAQRCLDAQRELGDQRGRAYTLVTLAEIQAAQHQPAGAEATLHAALALAREHRDRQAEAHSHRALGEVRLARHDPAAAVAPLTTALALFTDLDLPRWRARTLQALEQARKPSPVTSR